MCLASACLCLALMAVDQSGGSAASPRPLPDLRCGGYSLYTALQALDLAPETYEAFEKDLGPPGPSGYSMLQLADHASRFGARALAVKTSIENLRARPEPFACIALINPFHYVLLYEIDDHYAHVVDYPRQYRAGIDAFRGSWSGEALLIGRGALRSEESVTFRRRLRAAIVPAILTAGVLVLGLAATLYMRRRASRPATLASLLVLAFLPVPLSGCSPDTGPDVAGGESNKAGASARSARLVVEPSRLDLGRVRLEHPGQQAVVEATLRNDGDEPLVVRRLALSCTCANAKVSTARIEPGAEATLRAEIKLGSSPEPRSSRITIQSTDPDFPETEFVVAWQALNPLSTPVPSLTFPAVAPNSTASRSLPVRLDGISLCSRCRLDASGDDRFLTTALTMRPLPRVASHGETAAGVPGVLAVADLDVTLKPRSDPEYFSRVVTLELVCDTGPLARLDLPITWQVQPIVGVAPARLFLGQVRAGERLSRRVLLRSMGGLEFRVHGVSCATLGVLAAAAHDSRPADVQPIALDFILSDHEGPWQSTVRFRTDHPGAETISLPISGIVVGSERPRGPESS